MGDVYEAHDRLLDRSVAVKLFRAAPRSDRHRFDAEVRLLAGLNHPVLVRVYDAGSEHDDAFVVLELIDGPPLSERLSRDAPLPSDEAADLGAELADGLAYIHERGVVHRDVTPANVLCGPDGRARLVDFGIARLLESPRVTATAMTIGTASYMAPEQVAGEDVTPAADVYALGLVLLEALTGRREFSGPVHEVVATRLTRDPDTTTGVPPVWRGLLERMCRRDPTARPTAAEVRDRARAIIPSESTAAFPAPGRLAGDGDGPATAALTAPLAAGAPTGPVTAPIGTGPATDVFAVPPLPATRSPRRSPLRGPALVLAGCVVLAVLIALGSALRRDSGALIVDDTPASTTPSIIGELLDGSGDEEPPPSTVPTTTATTATTEAPPASRAPERVGPLDPRSPDFDPFAVLPPGQRKQVERGERGEGDRDGD